MNELTDSRAVIIKSYHENFERVLHFIVSRINNVEDAENLAQDVWVRVLTLTRPVEEETLTSLIYVIARNLVNDYLRRLCHSRAYSEEVLESGEERYEMSPENLISAFEIARIERERVECLPTQRRIIYEMSRYQEKTPEEIAGMLSLSKRTVENHLRLGRRDVRSCIAAVV